MSNEKGGSIVVTTPGSVKIKGLVDAISEIEQYYEMEKMGGGIPKGFFTTKNKIEFSEVGFVAVFWGGLISVLLTPISIGVIDKMIPIFGSSDPSVFDKIFVFVLAFSYELGTAFLMGSIGRCYAGEYTGNMIKYFLGGVIAGAVVKMVLVFLFFHFMYLVVLDADRIASFLFFFKFAAAPETLNKIYRWLMEFKPVFLTSAWFIAATTMIFIGIPITSIVITTIKNSKKKGGF